MKKAAYTIEFKGTCIFDDFYSENAPFRIEFFKNPSRKNQPLTYNGVLTLMTDDPIIYKRIDRVIMLDDINFLFAISHSKFAYTKKIRDIYSELFDRNY